MSTEFYLLPSDLYRLGNATSPKLDNIRPKDIDTYELNGVMMVRSGNKGISLFDWDELSKRNISGWVWKISAGVALPQGLRWNNDHGGHYMIIPVGEMTLDRYRALLSELALKCQRVLKI